MEVINSLEDDAHHRPLLLDQDDHLHGNATTPHTFWTPGSAMTGLRRNSVVAHEEAGFAFRFVTTVNNNRRKVISFWALLWLLCLFFALQFIKSVVLKYDSPAGTIGAEATEVFLREFPGMAHDHDSIILLNALDNKPILTPETRQFMDGLTASLGAWGNSPSNPATTFRVLHYFLLIDSGALTTARSLVSNTTAPEQSLLTIAVVSIVAGGFEQGSMESNSFIDWLTPEIHTLKDEYLADRDVRVDPTGMPAFSRDLIQGTEHDMIAMDGLTLPFAMAVLAMMLKSVRLLIVPLINISCTVACAFALMYPVAKSHDVIAICPSVMMSAAIAFSIDDSLFLLSRFREEVMKGAPVIDAVIVMVDSAGHTILVSGVTIALCWFGLATFPVMLLATVGFGAGITVVITFIVNITLTPALLLTFPTFFSNFDNFGFCCCAVADRTEIDTDEQAVAEVPRARVMRRSSSFSEGVLSPSRLDNFGRDSYMPSPAGSIAPTPTTAAIQPMPVVPEIGEVALAPGFGVVDPAAEILFLRENSVWFRFGEKCFGTKLRAAIAVIAIMLPMWMLAPYALSFHHSESFQLFTPRSSAAGQAAETMNVAFGGGRIAPYSLVVKANETSDVLSKDFFEHMHDVIENVILKIGGDKKDNIFWGIADKKKNDNKINNYNDSNNNNNNTPGLSGSGISAIMYLRGRRVPFSGAPDGFSLVQCGEKLAGTMAESKFLECAADKCPKQVAKCEASTSCTYAQQCVHTCVKNTPGDVKCFLGCNLFPLMPLAYCGINQCIRSTKQERSDEFVHSVNERRLSELPKEAMWSLVRSAQGGFVVDHIGVLNAFLFRSDIRRHSSHSPLLLGASNAHKEEEHGSMLKDIPVDCTSVFVQVLQQVKLKFQPEFGISSYTWIGIELSMDPFSARGAAWLDEARDTLKAQGEKDGGKYYLAGGSTAGHDTVIRVYELFPIVTGGICLLVFAIMGLAFKSIVIPLSSLVTIATTLSLVYGLGVLTYEHDLLKWTGFFGVISPVEGELSWLVPAMCLAVIVGLSVDFSVFLLERCYEYRAAGFSDRDSVICGVAQTGSVITGAGTIMMLAFGGLLFSDNPSLNETSFFLVIAVVVDTFIVRTVLVPSVMILLGEANWYPRTNIKVLDY